ncbi:MAG: hypothetical protein RL607_1061 [Bacteroidota bacterium]|jgi:hypothetical protein
MHPALVYTVNQPEPYKAMMMHCMATIERCVPGIELRFRYKIPFYYLNNTPFCYLAPNHRKNYLDIGFSKGFQLTNQLQYLNSENRSTVKSLRYMNLEAINQKVLEAILTEAITLY